MKYLIKFDNNGRRGETYVAEEKTQEQVTVSENEILHQLDHWLNEDHVCDHDHHHGGEHE